MDDLDLLRQRRKDPKDREARILLAQALLVHAQKLERGSQKRIELLSDARHEDPYNFSVLKELALDFHCVGNVEESDRVYVEALRLVPDHSETLAHHALLLFEAYKVDSDRESLLYKALERFETAHHCDPNSLLPIFGLIDVHLECPVAEVTQKVLGLMTLVPVGTGHAAGFVARFARLALALRRLGSHSIELLESLGEKLAEAWSPLSARCPELKWLGIIVEVWRIPLDELPDKYAEWRLLAEPGAVLYLLIRERLKEFGQHAERLLLIEKMLEKRADDPFLRRERMALLHLSAKRSLALGDIAEADRIWHRALTLDPHNDRLLQNLALIALARDDDGAIEVLWERVAQSWVLKGELFPDNEIYLELLGLYAHLFAERLYKKLSSDQVAGEALSLAERWLTFSIQSVVLRGLSCHEPNIEPLRFLVEEDLAGFLRLSLRSLLELTEASLFEPLQKDPPFHYDALDIEKSASKKEILQAVERALMLSDSLQNASVQDAVATLNDLDSRQIYDESTLDWDIHALNRSKSKWLLHLRELLTRFPSMKMTMMVQLVLFSYDFATLMPYYTVVDAELYAQTRDELIQGYCSEVLASRFTNPGPALDQLSKVAGSLDRWLDAHDCCALARIFNECELIYMSRERKRSSVNGLAKGIYLLKRAQETASDIETRARILQQFSEIETQEPGDVITTPGDGDPETKRRLTMALNEIRSRNYDQARLRLESLLKKRPYEVGALLMVAKITMEEAFLAYRLTNDIEFLEMQLAEAKQVLSEILKRTEVPHELKTPCQRMIWQINGTLDKARESEAKASKP